MSTITVAVGSGVDNELVVAGVAIASDPTKAALQTSPVQGATGRITAGGPAPGQVLKNYTGTVTLSASAQSVALETVTTGRSYLITDIMLTQDDTLANLVTIQAAGVAIVTAHVNTAGFPAPGIESQPTATTGQAVTFNVPAGTVGKKIAFNIFGIEQ